MKTKYLIIITVLLSTIFFQSCSDFLDEKNESDPVTADYYKTNEGFNSLIIAVYAQWKEIYGQSLPWFFWCGTDIYTTGNSEEPEDLMVYSTLNHRSEAIDKHYRICFDIIQKVNMGLYFSEITDQSNPDLKARIGELQFFRAFAYFLLVQDYGCVPIGTDYL